MIRPSARFLGAAALIAFFVSAFQIVAQQHVPPAPDSTTAEPAPAPQDQPAAPAQEQPAPSAPAPSGPPVFPAPDPANFTASAPKFQTGEQDLAVRSPIPLDVKITLKVSVGGPGDCENGTLKL